MTSDGITAADWEHIHELAIEIVNRSAAEDSAGARPGHVRSQYPPPDVKGCAHQTPT
jgi:hypothetical protein